MDYRPNIDAVVWFVEQVLPLVQARVPQLRFVIVGSKPARRVKALAGHAGVEVTGSVPDVRSYLAAASVVVAPLRMARGIQNKVLEALAMARPTVATAAALRGLGARPIPGVVTADDPSAFAAAVQAQMRIASVPEARQFVLREFTWPRHLETVARLFNEHPACREAAA
jgi:glycosyltransferase involved in cell wall biosynthesis